MTTYRDSHGRPVSAETIAREYIARNPERAREMADAAKPQRAERSRFAITARIIEGDGKKILRVDPAPGEDEPA